ncbi:hypothetical protein BOTBODRAFT_182272 [Botryobasidium botryosum FD-172 SS1]|uniref:CCHC-type domain-containing protein n=1 Tax=Botryobasidium botryosum (strain FD-172 SS1) TaxID=930990 RepID=A0A067LRV6_BOTB1|nr:hypothetical protein BOTBODRAFT_182272 [Botryobasidium botryosum FD-172 SS1]
MFKALFLVIFGNPDHCLKAATKVCALHQCGSAAIYTTEFSALAGITEWDEKALINAFHDGLKDQIKMEIAQGKQNMSLRTPTMSYPTHHVQCDPNAMDVDAVHTGPLPRFTDNLCDQLRREGACFRCRQHGHMARECPNCQGPPGASRVNSVALTLAPNTRDKFVRNPYYVHSTPTVPASASIMEVSGPAEAGF